MMGGVLMSEVPLYSSHHPQPQSGLGRKIRPEFWSKHRLIRCLSTEQFLSSIRLMNGAISGKVDARLPGKGNSKSHGARPIHFIITMIKWIRTSRLSTKNSLLTAAGPTPDAVGVWGLGFGVWGFVFRVLGFRFKISDFRSRVPGLGFGVSGLGLRVGGQCALLVRIFRISSL